MECHYVISGPPDSPFYSGEYHGCLSFPKEYPFKPPSIKIFTPNGRFEINKRLCLSMSDFHPSSWNPAWSVATILNGLLSFMMEDTPTTGSITSTTNEKKIFALRSHKHNMDNKLFRDIFPDLCASYVKSEGDKTTEEAQVEKVETAVVEGNSVNFRSFAIVVFFLVVYAFINRLLNRLY